MTNHERIYESADYITQADFEMEMDNYTLREIDDLYHKALRRANPIVYIGSYFTVKALEALNDIKTNMR